MAGPKVTVVGAGSYFFGKPVIWKMATSEILAGGTLALVDTNPSVLKTMMQLARRILQHTQCKVKLIGSTDRREVMKDSDFVVLTFSDRNTHFRKIDTNIAAKHGITMCSSDTIGPGGIFRAMREIPHALAVANDAGRLAPNAWIINFINPTAVLGMALRRFAPDMRSFALCDGHHEPHCTLNWCRVANILPMDAREIPPEVLSKLDLAIGGVNHFTWLWRFRYSGKDMMPAVRRFLLQKVCEERKEAQGGSKSRFNRAYTLELMDIFGAYPDTVSHTKEYVPFFQGYGVAPVKPEPIQLFDADARAALMAKSWEDTKRYASGKLRAKQFVEKSRSDHATDIIESMWGNLRRPFFINSDNRGAVPNLADDAFLELRSDVDLQGVRPRPVGPMPRGILGMTQTVLDTHEMTAEAAVTGDRALLRRAMLTDPLCNNIGDADGCIKDLLEAERDALPSYWYKRTRK